MALWDANMAAALITDGAGFTVRYLKTGSLPVTLLDAAVQQLHSRGDTAEGGWLGITCANVR